MSLMSVPESLHFSSCFVLALFAERFGFGKRRENQHLARRLSCPNVLRLLLPATPCHHVQFCISPRLSLKLGRMGQCIIFLAGT